MRRKRILAAMLVLLIVSSASFGQTKRAEGTQGSNGIPRGAKVFVGPIGDGFDQYLKDAIVKKQVPVQLADKRENAGYEITGVSESQKASVAKKVLLGNWHSGEEASITIANLKSGEVVWAYSVHESSSSHGKRSSAEACAKHLKDAVGR